MEKGYPAALVGIEFSLVKGKLKHGQISDYGKMMTEVRKYLLIGNSAGIGLATTEQLLAQGHLVFGISRSASPLQHASYQHRVVDVAAAGFREQLVAVLADLGTPAACIYCAGVGNQAPEGSWGGEDRVFAVNLLGAVIALEELIPRFLAAGGGHFIGLSSLLDDAFLPDAASYCGAKAGFSAYLKGMGLRLRKAGIYITNLRFGYVDTKMAKGTVRPMMITTERAATIILRCLRTRPLQLSYPKAMGFLVRLIRWWHTLRVWCR